MAEQNRASSDIFRVTELHEPLAVDDRFEETRRVAACLRRGDIGVFPWASHPQVAGIALAGVYLDRVIELANTKSSGEQKLWVSSEAHANLRTEIADMNLYDAVHHIFKKMYEYFSNCLIESNQRLRDDELEVLPGKPAELQQQMRGILQRMSAFTAGSSSVISPDRSQDGAYFGLLTTGQTLQMIADRHKEQHQSQIDPSLLQQIFTTAGRQFLQNCGRTSNNLLTYTIQRTRDVFTQNIVMGLPDFFRTEEVRSQFRFGFAAAVREAVTERSENEDREKLAMYVRGRIATGCPMAHALAPSRKDGVRELVERYDAILQHCFYDQASTILSRKRYCNMI